MSHVIPSGHSLRGMRISAHLTQKALAERAGLSQSLISRIEKGTVDPRLSTIKKIIETLSTLTPPAAVARDIMCSPVISIKASQPIRTAVELMKQYDISQLPIMRGGFVVGSAQESIIVQKMAQVKDMRAFFEDAVYRIMDAPFPSVSPNTPLEDIVLLLSKGSPALLVMQGKKPIGIITKIDLILALLKGGERFQRGEGGILP